MNATVSLDLAFRDPVVPPALGGPQLPVADLHSEGGRGQAESFGGFLEGHLAGEAQENLRSRRVRVGVLALAGEHRHRDASEEPRQGLRLVDGHGPLDLLRHLVSFGVADDVTLNASRYVVKGSICMSVHYYEGKG